MRIHIAFGIGLGLAAAVGCSGPQRIERSDWFRVSRRDFEDQRFVTQPSYLSSLAASYWAEERYEDAKDTYMSALQLQYGENFEGQVALGQLHEREGNLNRAAAHYARAASIRPGHLAGWYHLNRVKPQMTIAPDGLQADGYNPRTMGKSSDEDAGDDG